MTLEERQDAEANAFAMSLLMPEALVREHVKVPVTEQHVVELAKLFQVSEVHMTLRLVDLKLIRRARR